MGELVTESTSKIDWLFISDPSAEDASSSCSEDPNISSRKDLLSHSDKKGEFPDPLQQQTPVQDPAHHIKSERLVEHLEVSFGEVQLGRSLAENCTTSESLVTIVEDLPPSKGEFCLPEQSVSECRPYAVSAGDTNENNYKTYANAFPDSLSDCPATCVPSTRVAPLEPIVSANAYTKSRVQTVESGPTPSVVCPLSADLVESNGFQESTPAYAACPYLPDPKSSDSALTSCEVIPVKQLACKPTLPTSPPQVHFCNLCGKQYRHSASLRNHMRKHESGIFASKRFRCSYCAYSSQYNRNVIKHIETTHCNPESLLPLRPNHLQSPCLTKLGPTLKESFPQKVVSPDWKCRNSVENLYGVLQTDSLAKSQLSQLSSTRRNPGSLRNPTQTSFYRPRWTANESPLIRSNITDADNSRCSEYQDQRDMSCNFVGSAGSPVVRGAYHCDVPGCNRAFRSQRYLSNHSNDCHNGTKSRCFYAEGCQNVPEPVANLTFDFNAKRNSLQELLSPDNNDTFLNGIRPNKRPSENGCSEISQVSDGPRHLAKRQQNDYQLSDAAGMCSKNVRYNQSDFTTSTSSTMSDVYCFPGSNCNYQTTTSSGVISGYQRMTDHVTSEMANFPLTNTTPSSNSPSVPRMTLPSETPPTGFGPMQNMQQCQRVYHRSPVQHQPSRPDMTSVTVESTKVNGNSDLSSEKSNTCADPFDGTVEQLLCTSECPDYRVNLILKESHDKWSNVNSNAFQPESDLGVGQDSSFSRVADDLSEVRCELSETNRCCIDFPVKPDDPYTQQELTSEAEAFFSDLEEILAREVPLFDRSTPQQPNTELNGDMGTKPDSTTSKTSPWRASGKLFNTASMMSGDSGLESWSSSSSCSAGANGSSVWGSQETVTQLKSSPCSTTPQVASGFAVVGAQDQGTMSTFDHTASVDQPMDDLLTIRGSSESELYNVSNRRLEQNIDERISLSSKLTAQSLSPVCEQSTFRMTRTPGAAERDSACIRPHDSGARPHEEYMGSQLVNPQFHSSKLVAFEPYAPLYDSEEPAHVNRYVNHSYNATSQKQTAFCPTNVPVPDCYTSRDRYAHTFFESKRAEPNLIHNVRPGVQLCNLTGSGPFGYSSCTSYRVYSNNTKIDAVDVDPHQLSDNSAIPRSDFKRFQAPCQTLLNQSGHPSVRDSNCPSVPSPGYAHPSGFGSSGPESVAASHMQIAHPQFQSNYDWFVNRASGSAAVAPLHPAARLSAPDRNFTSTSAAPRGWPGDSFGATSYQPMYQQHGHQQQAYRTYHNMHCFDGPQYTLQSGFSVDQLPPQSQRYGRQMVSETERVRPTAHLPISTTTANLSPSQPQPSASGIAYLRRTHVGEVSSVRQIQVNPQNFTAPSCPSVGSGVYLSSSDQNSRVHDTTYNQISEPYHGPANNSGTWQVSDSTGLGTSGISYAAVGGYGQDVISGRRTDQVPLPTGSMPGRADHLLTAGHTSHHPSHSTDVNSSMDLAKSEDLSFVTNEAVSTVHACRSGLSTACPHPQTDWTQCQITESGDNGPYATYQLTTTIS